MIKFSSVINKITLLNFILIHIMNKNHIKGRNTINMTNIDIIYQSLAKELPKQNILLNEPMTNHTSFKIGGNADIFVKVYNLEELRYVLQISKESEIPIFVLGNGTNILVKDKGIRGIVLKIDINYIEINKIEDKKVEVCVGAGVKLIQLAKILQKEEISGFEFASGIPGTIGGSIRMNAGAYGMEMKDVVFETTYIDFEGNLHTIKLEEHEFQYRRSVFFKNKGIIIKSKLHLTTGEKEEIIKKMNTYLELRKEKQPIEFSNAGSTFKRGEDYITAKLIDEAGLKGYKIGNAEVSTKHSGFIVNTGNATAKDVLDLIEYVKQEVYNKFNKKIDLEIEIIGE